MAGEKILVIDDSPTILKVVQLVLTKAGFSVGTAADGEAGVAAARERRPDLILLDFVMPKMNGYQVCRALAEDEELRDVPVVLMSAKGDQVGERFVKVMGIVDYITKPFSPEAITAVVTHTIAKYRGSESGGSDASPDSESRAEAADAAHNVHREALNRLREGLARAIAAGIIADSKFVGMDLDPTDLAKAARAALSDSKLQALLGEIQTSAPDLADSDSAVLTGDLGVVPLADVLSLLQSQQQTGVLTVTRGGARVDLYFSEGTVELATAAGMPDEFRLGRFIADAAMMEEADLEAALSERDTAAKGLLGTSLVKQGAITQEELRTGLGRQTAELVYELLRWSFGRFTLRALETLPAKAQEARLALTVDGILMEGFRRVDEWHLIEREVDTFDLVFLRNDDTIQQMGRGRLTREELAVLELVNGKNSVKDIIRQSRMSSFDVSKMLYRLLSIKLIRKRVAPVAV
ncbi:MAG: response regulator [Polyangia bacterium]|jgi:CheY-like chemotaxis protein|nr:response regulator [Polyangia bacterium]